MVSGLGRLEEHVGVAIAVEFARRLRSCPNKITLVKVGGRDLLDGVCPVGLHLHHLLLAHRREGRRRRAVRDRRVVKEDSQLAVRILLVAKGVLDAADRCGGGACEPVLAHCDGKVAVEIDLVVAEDDVCPALAAVDGEAGVLTRIALVDSVSANEIAHRLGAGGAERMVSGLGRLEEHVGVAIAVELARRLRSRADEIPTPKVGARDALDGIRPCSLDSKHLRFGDSGCGC